MAKHRKSDNGNGKKELYLIAPAAEADAAGRVVDPSVEDEGLREGWRAIVGGRREVKVDAGLVESQIDNYVTVLRKIADGDEGARAGSIVLSEMTLSLTISAEGNIGIASTSAEAGITLTFKRT